MVTYSIVGGSVIVDVERVLVRGQLTSMHENQIRKEFLELLFTIVWSHMSRSNVTDVEVSAFSECFLFSVNFPTVYAISQLSYV